MRALRALVRTRSGQIGESWRTVNLTGLSSGYDYGPRPNPVYAFGFWWGCVLYRNTSFSPVRSYARVMKSADGLAWETVEDLFFMADSGFPSYQTALFENLSASFANGSIIFSGWLGLSGSGSYSGFVILSENGTDWNFDDNVVVGASGQIAQASANLGNFLARTVSAELYRSTDFATWTKTRNNVSSIAQGAGVFVSCGSSPDAALSYSTDGLTWNTISAFSSKVPRLVNRSGGRFWVQTETTPRELWWSVDGINWFQATVPAVYQNKVNTTFHNVASAQGTWYLPFTKASAQDRGALLSSTGNAWQDISATFPGFPYFAEDGPFFFAPAGYSPQQAVFSP